ncbi:hypothetical protein [Micromonospora yangpuensis]|uniref:Uncharacterized protein n=1 Tax=Micromonospora yangpuensis TaxID=683228 RepID=A0A1C6VGC2_9ACTN|nr:hypothetical protein [Micromonospora yangpuensis]GGM30020.1 hypothetical protein GCM10012279_56110 [Micromonospora yangpuensis]SCL64940.1 hypothetical protein GA0070617_5610 [Micromonospora yangpuensis]
MTGPLPDPFADHPDWAPQPPRPIQIVPATGRRDLRGKRVSIGLPGLGWRNDLRADEQVVQSSRTYVPVIPEHEWYRAEDEQIEVFAPLVPVERVWVETLDSRPSVSTHQSESSVHLVSLDSPAHRAPVPVFEADSVTGRRVVHVEGATEHRDLRAVTESYSGTDGDICVRVTPEMEWYRWAWRGQPPTTLEVPVHLLWLE